MTTPITERDNWWRHAVIYQVYIRSFADGDGDGLGDIAGIRSRIPYLAGLGIDAIWINPWYPSPMADAGYDVIDYRGVEPLFGTLDDADTLIAEAHAAGLRVLLDIVPNHSSNEHRWFRQALAAAPGSPSRDRYIFRDGAGPHGDQPPNDWPSVFGGPAWTRIVEADGTPGQWYLHLFASEQPDWNWHDPDVRQEFEDTLRFWFDRGVDGFRIDVAHGLQKKTGLPDLGALVWKAAPGETDLDHPYWDREEVHEIYRSWRRIADSYDPPRVFVSESWVPIPGRLGRYVRGDELHTTFNFDYLVAPWLGPVLRRVVDDTIAAHTQVGAPATWVLSNHDVVRPVSRFGRVQEPAGGRLLKHFIDRPLDLELGVRRARAAFLLMLALPGSAYIYQGEELGLEEVEDLPTAVRQDPSYFRTGGEDPGRDGCRVPIPWSGDEPPYGFSPPGAAAPPWLPQPRHWGPVTVDAQQGDPDSFLSMCRAALALRRSHPALGDGAMRWLDLGDDVVAFERDPGFACIANVGVAAVPIPAGATVVLTSARSSEQSDRVVPRDTTVWLATAP
jgi:alpha-glucosidase